MVCSPLMPKRADEGGMGGLNHASDEGAQRRAMGADRAVTTEAQEQGAAVSRQPRGPGRHPLGSQDRRTLARLAAGVSVPGDLLATSPAVGRGWHLGEGLGRIPPRAGPPRLARLGGDLRGCDVRVREKGGDAIGKTKRGKGTKCMVVVDGEGVPLATTVHSASPAEVTLIEETLNTIRVTRSGPGRPRSRPDRLIADKAYDSDPLRERLAKRGIELIAPHRCNRRRPKTQDGRSLRRYKRRWKVERTFAWFQNFRRLVVRWERKSKLYLAFVHVACILLTLRAL